MVLRSAIAIALVSLFASFGADAYIPKVEYRFGEIVKSNVKAKNFRIKQTRTIYNTLYEGGRCDVTEEIFFEPPWRYARYSFSKDRSFAVVYDGSSALKILDKKWIEPREKPGIPLISAFFLAGRSQELFAFLASMGIVTDSQSLAKKNDFVTVLLGDRTRTQMKLWLDRDFWWPVGFFRKAGTPFNGDSEDIEIIYSAYKNIQGSSNVPMKIEKYSGTRGVTEEVAVSEIRYDVKLQGSVFDTSFLKKKYQPSRDIFTEPREFMNDLD